MEIDAATTCDRACDHCGTSVETENDHIACMGFCDQVTHIKCAKLNPPFVRNIQERSNLFWMCRQCAHLMNMTRFKRAMSSIGGAISSITDNHDERLTDLKQAISDNGKQIERLSRKVTVKTGSTPLSSRFAGGQPTPKRPREEHSKDPKPLLGGTKAVPSCAVLTVPPPKELFWLYLSRIHPSVKSEAVMSLAKDCLLCEDPIKVVPLVKKNADMASMNFISFKVGIDVKYRDAALDPATWPQGIVFREFEDVSTKNFWAPAPTTDRVSNSTPQIEITPASGSSQSSHFLSPVSDTGASPMNSS